jgi:hypothetical protein
MKKFSILLLLLGALAGQAVFAEEEGIGTKVGRGLEKGAQATAKGIEKGVDATGRGVNKGVEATGRFFKKADHWIDGKINKKGASTSAPGDK